MTRKILPCALCAVVLLVIYRPASAVIVAGDYKNLPGNVNQTAGSTPSGFNYWPSVGIYGSGAAVYLGNDWAITAKHLSSPTTTIGGIVYTVDSTVTLQNPNDLSVPLAARGQNTDLQLIHLQIDGLHPSPSVATPVIASSSPSQTDYLLSIGRGRGRGVATRTFNSTFSGTTPAVYTGYDLTTGQTMRWGDNLVSSASTTWTAFGAGGTPPYVAEFRADYTQFGGQHNEFQLTPGDSGGGVFRQVGGLWELTGLNLATGTFASQNAFTQSAFGNVSYMADLSIYRDQIMSIVPEPSSFVLAGFAIAGSLVGVIRRRRSVR